MLSEAKSRSEAFAGNGRVYDPVIGYFSSPDPMGTNSRTQSFNLYAYCSNNPLSAIDPSGYWSISFTWEDVVDFVGDASVAAMAVAITIATGGTGTGFSLSLVGASSAGGAVGGFFGTLLHGGSFNDAVVAGIKGAAFGAISCAGANAVGTIVLASGETSKALIVIKEMAFNGTLQGGLRVMQGGKFIHGFASGAVGALTPFIANKISADMQVIAAAAIGGTAEALGGGKFANGAITAAYVVLFNHLQHDGGVDDPIKKAQSEGGLAWDLNGDGKLQKDEAENWWLNGESIDISVDNSKIDWTGLKIPEGKSSGVFSISTTDAFLELPYETAAT